MIIFQSGSMLNIKGLGVLFIGHDIHSNGYVSP